MHEEECRKMFVRGGGTVVCTHTHVHVFLNTHCPAPAITNCRTEFLDFPFMGYTKKIWYAKKENKIGWEAWMYT